MESGPPLTIWSASGGKAIERALFLRGRREKRRRRPLTAGPLSTRSELVLYGSSTRPLIFFHLSWKNGKGLQMVSHEAELESSEIIIGQQFWSSHLTKPCTVEVIERHLMSGMRERMWDEFYVFYEHFMEHFDANGKINYTEILSKSHYCCGKFMT